MITEQEIKQKTAENPTLLTETGARKILEHREKNRQKYGDNIYDNHDRLAKELREARATGDADAIKKAKDAYYDQFINPVIKTMQVEKR